MGDSGCQDLSGEGAGTRGEQQGGQGGEGRSGGWERGRQGTRVRKSPSLVGQGKECGF